MAATILPNAKSQFIDSNGKPLAGGSVYFYIPNTSTFKNTWQDPAQTILNTNPIVLDANGQALIWGAGTYRQVVYDQFNNLIWDQITEDTSSGLIGNMTDNAYLSGTGFTPGTTTTLTISSSPGSPANLWVFFDGVYQTPDTWSVSGTVVTFNSAIPIGVNEVNIKVGNTIAIGTPGSGSVTDASVALNAGIQSSKLSYNQGSSNAVTRTVKSRLQDFVTVKDFGAKGDGVTDDTSAFNNAIANMSGHCLYVPAGNYLIAGTINISVNNFKLLGDFEYGTTLTCNSPTDDLFDISASDIEIAGLNIVHSVTRTGGTTFNFTSGATHTLRDFSVFGAYTAISFSSTIAVIRDGQIRNTVATVGRSIVIGANSSGFDQLVMNIVMDAPSGSQPSFGIVVNQTNDLRIVQCEIQHQGTGMIISPGASQLAYAVWSDNTFFDSNVQRGVFIIPSSTGSVSNVRFSNCWFGNNGSHGCEINNSGTGSCSSIHFIDPQCVSNMGDGILLTKGDDFRILGGVFEQNSNGVHVGANQSDWSIIGASLGNFGGGTGNSGHGITIDSGSSTNFVIADCDIRGNAGNIFDGSSSSPGKYIHHNVGYKTSNSGSATLLSGNSSIVVSHGLDVQPQGYEIQLTATGSPGAAGISNFWVSAVTATTFTISSNASATSNLGFGWSVNTAGA